MELRVNGIMIGHIYVVNVTDYTKVVGQSVYNYEIYIPEKEVIKGTVKHTRADGAFILINRIISKEKENLK